MRVRLGNLNLGDPPSLIIEADTEDDVRILDAVSKGTETHRAAFSSTYNCTPTTHGRLAGTVSVGLCWFKK